MIVSFFLSAIFVNFFPLGLILKGTVLLTAVRAYIRLMPVIVRISRSFMLYHKCINYKS